MIIDQTEVYGLAEAVAASRLPHQLCAEHLYDDVKKSMNTATKLARNPSNSGHPNFLKGITVNMLVASTVKWWNQAQRYSHFVIVSSTSTMHCIERMVADDACWGERVLPETKELCHTLLNKYHENLINFDTFIDNIPLGIELTAMVTTNYMQLRIIYNQRKLHKYAEWATFCDWIEHLPHATEFITNAN